MLVSYPLRPSSLFGTACYQTASKISVGGARYTGNRPLQAPERLLHQRLRLLQDFRIHLAAAARPAKNKSLRRAAGRGGIHDVIKQRRAGIWCKKKSDCRGRGGGRTRVRTSPVPAYRSAGAESGLCKPSTPRYHSATRISCECGLDTQSHREAHPHRRSEDTS